MPLSQPQTGLQLTTPHDFTPDGRQILTDITNISELPTPTADPILRGYLDWYLKHLQSRLGKPTGGNLVASALQPHLTNTSEVDKGLEYILSLISKVLVDSNGRHSIRRIYNGLLGVQEDVQPANPEDDDDQDGDSDAPLGAGLSSNTPSLSDEAERLEQCSPAIFHVIGQMTMLFSTPPPRDARRYSPSTTALHLSLADPSDSTRNLRSKIVSNTSCRLTTRNMADKDLPTLLGHFGQILPPWISDTNPNSLRFGDTLFSGNLSYEAMVKTAGIRIAWVDSFPLHLEFDARTVTLKVFRFPSFCAMLAHPKSAGSQFFDILLNHGALNESTSRLGNIIEAERSPITQDFWVELLCTYRLIFGQHSKRTHRLYEKNGPSSVPLANLDPLLDDLCGKPSKGNKHLEAIEAFPEKFLYSAESDFPVFGNRLLTLQNYITAQSPNSIKALWYDRRDIHRFWTFWAVIIFGGFSLLLSVVQTGLGAA